MRVKRKSISATDLLILLDNQWSTAKDIAAIGCVGINKAGKIRKSITEQIKNETGKDCPYGLVPTEYVKDYFGININYLKKFQKKEQV